MAVNGDIVIGLWRGSHKGSWDLPTCAYAFHTAFLVPGLLQVTPEDMDFPGSIESDHGFSMDILLEEDTMPMSKTSR